MVIFVCWLIGLIIAFILVVFVGIFLEIVVLYILLYVYYLIRQSKKIRISFVKYFCLILYASDIIQHR